MLCRACQLQQPSCAYSRRGRYTTPGSKLSGSSRPRYSELTTTQRKHHQARRTRPMSSGVSSTDPQAAGTDSTYNRSGMLRKAGQNFNSAGISLFLRMWWGNRGLALPHLDVPDIRSVDWDRLRAAGFKGCVFDKDNTLTEPYVGTVAPQLADALQRCRTAFDDKLVIFSNSAGLLQFDPEGKEAAAVEQSLGVRVLRHTEKKPAGGADDMERHFGCSAQELVMIGDRYFTDVVFGNRHGMLTIRPAPITKQGEPRVVRLVRRYEQSAVQSWRRKGAQPRPHPLLPSPAALQQCLLELKQ